MTDLSNLPRTKDISLTADVTITLPAYIWHGFVSSYSSAKWTCGFANAVALAVHDAILDPVWVKERDASHAEEHDMHRAVIARMMTGQNPELPPNMTDTP